MAFLLSLILGGVLASLPPAAIGISYGTAATEGEFPFAVKLTMNFESGKTWIICGGALIAPNMILTSGQCAQVIVPGVDSDSNAVLGNPVGLTSGMSVKVIAGEIALDEIGKGRSSHEQVRFVKSVIIYPGFFRRVGHHGRPGVVSQVRVNDVGLLVLTNPLDLNQFVNTVGISARNPDVETVDNVIVGWGVTEANIYPPLLLKTKTELVKVSECLDMAELLERDKSITEKVVGRLMASIQEAAEETPISLGCMLAPNNQSAICDGDGGNPIICGTDSGSDTGPYLCGVTSTHLPYSCGHDGDLHLPTFVAHMTESIVAWIQKWTTEFAFKCDDEDYQQFNCGDGSTCVPSSFQCDGKLDCPLGTDENGCAPCAPAQFRCPPYSATKGEAECLGSEFVCDGTKDCGSGSDEFACGRDKYYETGKDGDKGVPNQPPVNLRLILLAILGLLAVIFYAICKSCIRNRAAHQD